MHEANTAILVAAVVVLATVGFGGGFTYAQFTDTETKQVSVSAETWTTTPEETPAPSKNTISFVAFCVADETDSSGATVVVTGFESDDGEPVAVTYESMIELSTVVLFGGGEFENFEGKTSGTVVFGEGTTPESAGTGQPGTYDQMPSAPCPSDETQVIKYNYDDSSGAFVEDGSERSGSTGGVGAQSVGNTTGETDGTADSNATSTATSSETTVETASTPTKTETATSTGTETAPATSTATPSPTPTETAMTTVASDDGTDQQEGGSTENETTGSDAGA
jgi:hypothetical protein